MTIWHLPSAIVSPRISQHRGRREDGRNNTSRFCLRAFSISGSATLTGLMELGLPKTSLFSVLYISLIMYPQEVSDVLTVPAQVTWGLKGTMDGMRLLSPPAQSQLARVSRSRTAIYVLLCLCFFVLSLKITKQKLQVICCLLPCSGLTYSHCKPTCPPPYYTFLYDGPRPFGHIHRACPSHEIWCRRSDLHYYHAFCPV